MSQVVQEIVDKLKTMSLIEAKELVEAIEETFGVSAAAPVATMAAPVAAAPAEAEKTEFDVVVEAVPADKKIAVLKVVKEKKNIGLQEAKTMVEGAPFTLVEKVSKDEANALKDELSNAGATVTLK
jgi:large subunit ribosomal protein L7/L12